MSIDICSPFGRKLEENFSTLSSWYLSNYILYHTISFISLSKLQEIKLMVSIWAKLILWLSVILFFKNRLGQLNSLSLKFQFQCRQRMESVSINSYPRTIDINPKPPKRTRIHIHLHKGLRKGVKGFFLFRWLHRKSKVFTQPFHIWFLQQCWNYFHSCHLLHSIHGSCVLRVCHVYTRTFSPA